MFALLLVLSSVMPSGNPWLTDDPLFKIPSGAGYQRSTYFENSVSNFRKQKLGQLLYRAFKKPDALKKDVRIIDATGYEVLLAWGATGKKEAVTHLQFLLPKLSDATWVKSTLSGLARSMRIDAHRYVVKNLPYYNIPLHELQPVLNFMAIRDPGGLAPLLANRRYAQTAANVMMLVPSLTNALALQRAVAQHKVDYTPYLNYLKLTADNFSRAQLEKICSRLFSDYLTVVKQAIRLPIYWDVLSRCPAALADPRWTALLGQEHIKLNMLKAMRQREGVYFTAALSGPLRDLLTEYIGAPGWERLLISILGKIEDKKAVTMVASYVLSPNLWLREEALASLALGAHPNSGRMLHAGALESAGEEAVLYFAPYAYNIQHRKWRASSLSPLKGVLKRYIRAKDAAYKHAALFALAWLPSKSLRSVWWPVAKEYREKLIKEKKWDELAALLPLLANHPSGIPLVRKELGSEHDSLRSNAARVLGRVRDVRSVPQLKKLARTLTQKVAANAAWALGQIPGTDAFLLKLLSANEPAVAGNAALALIRRDFHGSGDGSLCTPMFTLITQKRLDNAVLMRAASYLRRRCATHNKSGLYRWVATLPQYLVLSLFGLGDLDWYSVSRKQQTPLFLRLLNRFHVGQSGKAYRVKLPSGDIFYGYTGIGGAVFHPRGMESGAQVSWVK